MAHFELHAWCLLILAWVFIPFFMRSKVFTMPEFLERRFSPNARWILSIISLVTYVVTKIAVGIFAGGVVFGVLLPEIHFCGLNSYWIGAILGIVVTGIYTMLGGMRALAYTETLQTAVLILGSLMVVIFGLNALGQHVKEDGSMADGWKLLYQTCSNRDEGRDMFNLWKPLLPKGVEGTWEPVIEKQDDGTIVKQAWYFKDKSQHSHYPWLGMLFCAPIIGLWYWCTDQYIVQRALSAKSEKDARRGSIFAACLKMLPVFLFIIPGMVCFALAYHGQPGLEQLLTNENGVKASVTAQSQGAFPMMVREVLPPGNPRNRRGGSAFCTHEFPCGVFNACATLSRWTSIRNFRKNVSNSVSSGSAASPPPSWCSSDWRGFRLFKGKTVFTTICRVFRGIFHRRFWPFFCSASS